MQHVIVYWFRSSSRSRHPSSAEKLRPVNDIGNDGAVSDDSDRGPPTLSVMMNNGYSDDENTNDKMNGSASKLSERAEKELRGLTDSLTKKFIPTGMRRRSEIGANKEGDDDLPVLEQRHATSCKFRLFFFLFFVCCALFRL